MNNNYIKQQLLKMSTQVSFPYCISIHYINQNGAEEVFNYNNSDTNIYKNGVTYSPCLFSVNPSTRTQESIGNATLNLADTDLQWTARIRNTQNRSYCYFYEMAVWTDSAGNRQVEIIDSIKYILTSATWDGGAVQWTMVFDENMDIIIPCDKGNSQITSGCC